MVVATIGESARGKVLIQSMTRFRRSIAIHLFLNGQETSGQMQCKHVWNKRTG